MLIKVFKYLLFAVILSGCKPEDECEGFDRSEKYYQFTSDTAIIPYSGLDSLYFEIRDADSIILDTCLFVSGIKKRFQVKLDGGTCTPSPTVDAFSLTFKSETWPDSIGIKYQTSRYSNSAEIEFRYKLQRYMINTAYLSPTFAELTLSGYKYFNVIRVCEQPQPVIHEYNCIKYPLLVNKDNGILYLRSAGSHILTIIRK